MPRRKTFFNNQVTISIAIKNFGAFWPVLWCQSLKQVFTKTQSLQLKTSDPKNHRCLIYHLQIKLKSKTVIGTCPWHLGVNMGNGGSHTEVIGSIWLRKIYKDQHCVLRRSSKNEGEFLVVKLWLKICPLVSTSLGNFDIDFKAVYFLFVSAYLFACLVSSKHYYFLPFQFFLFYNFLLA